MMMIQAQASNAKPCGLPILEIESVYLGISMDVLLAW